MSRVTPRHKLNTWNETEWCSKETPLGSHAALIHNTVTVEDPIHCGATTLFWRSPPPTYSTCHKGRGPILFPFERNPSSTLQATIPHLLRKPKIASNNVLIVHSYEQDQF